jgi:hypothetical protein
MLWMVDGQCVLDNGDGMVTVGARAGTETCKLLCITER